MKQRHSQSEDGRGGLVRAREETDRTRCTHFLETVERETGQNKERKRPSEGHRLPGDEKKEQLVRTRK